MSGASSVTQGPPPQVQLLQMLGGKTITAMIGAAAELGIADLLAAGERTVEDLASTTGSHAPSLYRLLRGLASLEIFKETAPRTFTLTPMAACLRSDAPDSLRALARFDIAPCTWLGWGELLHCVRTGETSLRKAFGLENPFDYFAAHPQEAAIFNGAMTDISRRHAPAVAQAYDFGRFRTLTDIGGGHGMMLAAILQRFPALRGVLFDQAGVAEQAHATLAAYGVADRCGIVAGSFFESVPPSDGYMMQHIIHDWEDERAIEILRNIRKAIEPQGRLLVMESLIAPGNAPSLAKLLDLNMMVLAGGRERTETEYRDLLAAGGFRLVAIHASGPRDAIQVLEAAPDSK